jgi:hypothetical protein
MLSGGMNIGPLRQAVVARPGAASEGAASEGKDLEGLKRETRVRRSPRRRQTCATVTLDGATQNSGSSAVREEAPDADLEEGRGAG